jgi:hypothetical protein
LFCHGLAPVADAHDAAVYSELHTVSHAGIHDRVHALRLLLPRCASSATAAKLSLIKKVAIVGDASKPALTTVFGLRRSSAGARQWSNSSVNQGNVSPF